MWSLLAMRLPGSNRLGPTISIWRTGSSICCWKCCPAAMIEPLERAEYNRRSVLMMEGVHDSAGAAFRQPGRTRAVRRTDHAGQDQATVIDQFQRRGRLPFREEAPLLSQEQFALLVALGFKPGLPPAARHSDASGGRARTGAVRCLRRRPRWNLRRLTQQWLISALQAGQSAG